MLVESAHLLDAARLEADVFDAASVLNGLEEDEFLLGGIG